MAIKRTPYLNEFYDRMTGRFQIPFDAMVGSVTEEVLSLMTSGYALSAYSNGDERMYTLFKLKDDCSGYKPIETAGVREYLYSLLHDKSGCHYFTKMFVEEYFSNELYQRAVDFVLLADNINVYGSLIRVVLRCSEDGKYFEWLEAEDCFA